MGHLVDLQLTWGQIADPWPGNLNGFFPGQQVPNIGPKRGVTIAVVLDEKNFVFPFYDHSLEVYGQWDGWAQEDIVWEREREKGNNEKRGKYEKEKWNYCLGWL